MFSSDLAEPTQTITSSTSASVFHNPNVSSPVRPRILGPIVAVHFYTAETSLPAWLAAAPASHLLLLVQYYYCHY